MTLTIQGSFEAYVWAALWQMTLGVLQSGAPPFHPQFSSHGLVTRLQHAAGLMGSAVSWVAWALGIWVGMRDGILAGVAFSVFCIATNVVTLVEMRRFRQNVMAAQIIGLVAMPVFASMTLNALGVFDL